MGSVHRLPASRNMTIGATTDAYLATLAGDEQSSTRRVYAGVLRRLGAECGTDHKVGDLEPEAVAEWFTATWSPRSPSTWNVALDALRSAAAYWSDQGWISADPTRLLRRRKPRPDRDRALSREQVDELLARGSIPLRDRLPDVATLVAMVRNAGPAALNQYGAAGIDELLAPSRPPSGSASACGASTWSRRRAAIAGRPPTGCSAGLRPGPFDTSVRETQAALFCEPSRMAGEVALFGDEFGQDLL